MVSSSAKQKDDGAGQLTRPLPVGANMAEQNLTHTDETMQKVYQSLRIVGLTDIQIIDAVTEMQNRGIYFREVERFGE